MPAEGSSGSWCHLKTEVKRVFIDSAVWQDVATECNLICLWMYHLHNITVAVSQNRKSWTFVLDKFLRKRPQWMEKKLLFSVLRVHIQSIGCPVHHWLLVLFFVPFWRKVGLPGTKTVEQGTWWWQNKYKGEDRELWPSKSPQTGHPYEKSKDWRQGTSFGRKAAEKVDYWRTIKTVI